MGSLRIGEAAFAGFRLVRENLRAVGIWAALGVIVSLATNAMLQPLGGPQALLAPPANPQALLRAAPAAAGLLVVALLANAIVQTAINRVLLRPGERGYGFVRLGRDEVRQLGVALQVAALIMALYLLIFLVLGVVILVAGQTTGSAGLGARGPASGVMALTAVVLSAVVSVIIVRFSLAPALAFDRGRIDLRGALALTRGRFWSLLAVYALTALMLAVVYALYLMVAAGLLTAIGLAQGQTLAQVAVANPPPLSPMGLATAGLDGLLGGILWPVMYAPAAVVYRALRAPPPAPAAAEGAPWGRA